MLRDGYEKQNLLFFSTINEIYIEGSHKTGDSIEKKSVKYSGTDFMKVKSRVDTSEKGQNRRMPEPKSESQ